MKNECVWLCVREMWRVGEAVVDVDGDGGRLIYRWGSRGFAPYFRLYSQNALFNFRDIFINPTRVNRTSSFFF